MLHKSKLALLRVAKAQLGLGDDDYRAILENFGGTHSASHLDGRGFDAVMDRFRGLGFTSSSRRRSFGERDGMASPGQVAAIRKLWTAYADAPTEASLNAFLERQAKVSALRFLNASKAGPVITALKAMVERKAHADA
ncbi:MAG TPA: regulatory protein GemA [Caulobacteraceae bacterium]|jgi:hypothetical protein|nr:regulatory protein GemA [Caulobacteraceae bacterium]